MGHCTYAICLQLVIMGITGRNVLRSVAIVEVVPSVTISPASALTPTVTRAGWAPSVIFVSEILDKFSSTRQFVSLPYLYRRCSFRRFPVFFVFLFLPCCIELPEKAEDSSEYTGTFCLSHCWFTTSPFSWCGHILRTNIYLSSNLLPAHSAMCGVGI